MDTKTYLSKPLDDRIAANYFQFDIFEQPFIGLFSSKELALLEEATKHFHNKSNLVDLNASKKELMRFIVEFSWKTSQIEGNTYDLISTEKLLLYGERSPSNTEFEAQMILNQKDALEFILENPKIWRHPSLPLIGKLHDFVGKNLNITRGFRKTLVGITGTNYRPLENEFQIKEAVDKLLRYIGYTQNNYEKALLSVLGLSYIQPFVDGNKRTSRLLGNAILISDNLAPLSYRSVNDRSYKEATLVFYEQNSVIPFKELFIEQYIFSAENYNLNI